MRLCLPLVRALRCGTDAVRVLLQSQQQPLSVPPLAPLVPPRGVAALGHRYRRLPLAHARLVLEDAPRCQRGRRLRRVAARRRLRRLCVKRRRGRHRTLHGARGAHLGARRAHVAQ